MTPYQGPQLELYKEALRTVPALAAARLRDDENDGLVLVRSYLDLASELNIEPQTAWGIAFSASQVTIFSLVDSLATQACVEPYDVVQKMVAAAQHSVATNAL